MPPSVLEIIGPSSRLPSLPVDVSQKASPIAALARLALLLPALLLVLVPTASLLMGSTPVLAHASAQPGEALLAACGVTAFLVLFGWPFGRAIQSLGTCRRVRIEGGVVSVEDRCLWRTVRWRLPLPEYAGVTHLVRTNWSGTRHDIMLVHPVRTYRVLVCTAERFSESEVAGVARLLRLPQIPARDLLAWRLRTEQQVPVHLVPPSVAQAA